MANSRPFCVTTWNVNGIRAHLDHVAMWLAEHEPDVLLLQETKVEDALFPRVPFMELGYTVSLHGAKARAGVATISKTAPTETIRGFREGPKDDHCRILDTVIDGVRFYNLYVPNGRALNSPSFAYKLEWLQRLRRELDETARPEDPLILAGDFNIAPEDRDVYDAEAMRGRIHFSEQEHAALEDLGNFGLYDCFRRHCDEPGHFSWFDYRNNAFVRGIGLRIDLIYATASLYQRCTHVTHDTEPRQWDAPSDHVPVTAHFHP